MSIARDAYMKKMAERGHHGKALGEAALALVGLWEKADLQNRRDVGKNLVNEFYRVLMQIYGYQHFEARAHCAELKRALKEVDE